MLKIYLYLHQFNVLRRLSVTIDNQCAATGDAGVSPAVCVKSNQNNRGELLRIVSGAAIPSSIFNLQPSIFNIYPYRSDTIR